MTGPIFDTHAHYTADAFDADRDTLLASLPEKGIVGICEQSTSSADAAAAVAMAHKYPFVWAAVGIHPESLLPQGSCPDEMLAPTITRFGGDWRAEMRALRPLYEDERVVAVGECGMDFHWPVPRDAQLEMFEAHIRLALELDKPIIVHDREAHAEVYALLKKYKPKGIVHCYSGSGEDAAWLTAQGMYLGFGGACTWKGAKRALKSIDAAPLDKILLETDCPYMAPDGFRGQRCDSSMLTRVSEVIAARKGTTPDAICQITEENARRVFQIPSGGTNL